MDQLLERYFYGELNADEKQLLFSALEKDTKLKDNFIKMQHLNGLMALSSQGTAGSEEAKQALHRFYAGVRATRWRRTIYAVARYAAVVVVAALCTFLTVNYFNRRTDMLYSEVVVPAGQRTTITLSDGSSVCLNARSRIRIPNDFDSRNRKVYLDGEAYFDVTKVQGKPFIVETSRYNVRVLGTKFSVINYSEMPLFETTLLEGSVEVSNAANDKNIILLPDEQVRLTDDGLQKFPVNADNRTLWTNGILAFDSQPFSEIIKRIELYYDVKFIIQNMEALDIVYTGKFHASNSAEQIIDAIHRTNKFNYRMSLDNKIIYIQ